MSTDIDTQCFTQDSASILPGFSKVFFVAGPTKNVNTPVTVNFTPTIANSASSTDYNDGLYDENTGIVTVPVTGKWALFAFYSTSNGSTAFIQTAITDWLITGFSGAVGFVQGDDSLIVSQDVTSGQPLNLRLVKGTTLQLNSSYILAGNAGTSGPFSVRFGMQFISP